MIAPNPNLLCNQAESYFYDFLYKETIELIPGPIVSHIRDCATCQERINQLRSVLPESEEHPETAQREASGAVTEMLKLHFAYIGKPVTCDIVKPFLPSLLDMAIEIRIPTPITAHIDNCQECSEDLEMIRELNLSHKQLYRLSQLFAEKPAGSNINCTEAQSAVSSVVSLVFDKTNAIILKHLCICPDCRGLLYQHREMVLRGLRKTDLMKSKFPCEKVSARDFFDYVVPYGLNPAKDQYAKFRDSLTSHLRICPSCLVKMQQLHDIVYGIAERTESEVVTTYYIDESAKAKASVEFDDLYAGFPIRVEIASREDKTKAEETTATINFVATLKQKVSVKKLKPLLKTAIPAAAVILIGSALLLHTAPAKAVTLQGIYEAIEKVKNVYISRFVPDKTGPTQEKWVSRALNIYMTKTAEQCVLWDITDGVTKIKHLYTEAVETTRLSTEDIVSVEGKMSNSLGLMPFYDIAGMPHGAEWSRAIDSGLEATRGIEVYDLKWISNAYDGSSVFKKWRFFVNAKTILPQKIKIYQMLPTDTEYILMSLMTVEYLSDSKMQEVIKEVSF
jgi:hypothetical protein